MRGHRTSNVAELFSEVDVRPVDWARLYEEHAPRIRRIVARRVDPASAEDLVQETFLRAFRNRDSLDPGRPPGPWLNTIASRVVTDALRHRYASLEVLDSVDQESAVPDVVEEAFLDSVRRIGIKRGFASLNHRHRRVLQLVAVEGMTNKQAAEFEDMTIEAVESVLVRSRSKFKLVYTTFADRTGVLGGAVLGPMALRLRLRLQRLLDAAGQHTGAIAAAAVTVTVMAVATLPASRPVITKASERTAESRVVVLGAESASSFGAMEAMADTSVDGVSEVATTRAAKTTSSAPGREATNTSPTVEIKTTAHRQGQGAQAGFRAEDDVAGTSGRTYGGIEVKNCHANIGTHLECAVIDLVSQAQ